MAAGSPIKSLIVEVEGRTDKLTGALGTAGREVTKFGKQAEAAADAGGTLASKYAAAGRTISMSAAQMAEAGKVTGAASRQILAQASNIAFAFGPQGAIVGAVAITTMAIVDLFRRTKDEAKDAFDELNRLAEAGDASSTARSLNRLRTGLRQVAPDETDPEKLGINRLLEQREAVLAKAAGLRGKAAKEVADQYRRLTVQIIELQDRERSLTELVQEQAKAQAERAANTARFAAEGKAAAAAAAAQAEAEKRRWAALAAAVDAAGKKMQAALADAERREQDLARLREQYLDLAVGATATVLDDIARKYGQLIDAAMQLGDVELAGQFRALRDQLSDAARSAETLKQLTEGLSVDFKDVGDATKGVAEAGQSAADAFAEQALALQQAVQGALQLATAMGLVDQRTASALSSIAQVVTNLPRLQQALEAGKMGGTGGIVAAGLPVIGGLASLVGGLMASAKAAREHAAAVAKASLDVARETERQTEYIGVDDLRRQELEIRDRFVKGVQELADRLDGIPGFGFSNKDRFVAQGGEADIATVVAAQREALLRALTGVLGRDPGQNPTLTDAEQRNSFITERANPLLAAIRELDALAEQAKKTAEQLARLKQEQREAFDRDLDARELRLQGRDAEADALQLFYRQAEEFRKAVESGLFTMEQLARLSDIQARERERAAEAARKAAEEEEKRRVEEERRTAQQRGREREDAQTRLNAADGETPEERERRREIARRREIDDALAAGADEATIALLRAAQAAEALAEAAAEAAAAQRALEDLEVRSLRAQGRTADADRLALEQRQRREMEDAIAEGRSQEYLDRLREVLAEEMAAFLAGLEELTGEVADVASRPVMPEAVESALAQSAVGKATVEQADRMIGFLATQTQLLRSILGALQGAAGDGLVPPGMMGGGTYNRISITVQLYGPVMGDAQQMRSQIREAFGDELLAVLNQAFGAAYARTAARGGSAGITS